MSGRAAARYASILAQRLVQYTKGHQLHFPIQAGYRPELGILHQGFALQQVIDKHRHSSRKPLYRCFVDLKPAYDRVQWPLLWQLGVHGAIQSLCDGCLLSTGVGGACEAATARPSAAGWAVHSVSLSLASSLAACIVISYALAKKLRFRYPLLT